MADDIEVHGAEQFLRLSKALKHAGRFELRKELTSAMKQAARPLIADSRAEARRRLPKRGGLAARVAKTPQRVQVRTGASTAGVRIVVGSKGAAARDTNKGTVRHPVFGNRKVWVTQRVRPGWFEDPMQAGAAVVRRQLSDAVERVADQVVKEVR